ncbi:MAG: PQQ-binding-like beta-propeller repeat protein [Candidatus Contubernalis sp.]|nr:PQQ-binding-like beta-propeller repeat protein [Candidatus Contubernalis sp.]
MGCRRILLYIWLVSLTLTFIGCKGSSGTESAMCRANPQRTGVYSSPAVTEPPELKWKFKIAPERTGVYSSAVIAGLGLYSYPVIASGVVYFGSYCSGLHAVDAETGKEKWRFGIEDWAGTPVVAGGIVFFGSSYGSDQCVLYAVDIRTKEEKWSFQLEGGVLDVAVADGIVYLTGAKGTMETATGILYAVDVKTGMERWRFQKQGNLLSPPAIEDELVYISSDSAFYALNAKTGKEKWKCKIYDRLGCK